MRNTHLTLVSIFLCAALTANTAATAEQLPTKTDASMQVATDPATFATAATSSYEFQKQSGELAVEKALNSGVKEFAEQIIADVMKDREGLVKSIDEDGVPLPTSMLPFDLEELRKLKLLQGVEFDRAFVNSQMAASDNALEVFQNYAEHGPAGNLRNFAHATTSTFKMHQVRAKALQQ